MKTPLFFSIFGLVILLSSCSVPNAGNGFYQDHKRQQGVRNFTVPGWLIYTGTGLAHDIVREEEVRAVFQLAKRVKKVQFMLDEGNGVIPPAEVRDFQQHLRAQHFDDLIYIRAEDTNLSFMVRSKKDKLRDLILLMHTEEDFVFLNMRTNLKIKHLTKLLDCLLKPEDTDEEKPKAEEKQAEPVVVRPQA